MNLNLIGKNALVTGSSKGIGKAIAKGLHAEGCNIMLNGRNISELKKTVEDLGERVSFFIADVTVPQDCRSLVDAMIDRWGSLDVLVCNVGSGKSVKPGEENLEEWKNVFNKNLFSTTNMVEAATKELAKSHGSIVCISSISGIEVTGAPVTYSASKAALNAYVKGIARSLAQQGIRINAIAPGNVLFEGSVWEKKLSENPTFVQNLLKNEVALNRFGSPEEIANFVTFLASPLATFATGTMFVLDGGQLRS